MVHKGLKVCILFEGRDGAGKGGTIKAMTERVSPRIFRVVALPAPTEREKSQMYAQRYVPHLPAAGEIVIFDRSWYNRAGVERVLGFCTEEQAKHFLEMVPMFEKVVVESGVILLKYWLEVSPEEQTRRLEGRIDDGRKIWKLSDMDLKSYSRWYDYSRARDEMFLASDTAWAPWYVVHSDNKKRARLNALTHILSRIPYEELKREKVELPKRQHRAITRTPTTRSGLFPSLSEPPRSAVAKQPITVSDRRRISLAISEGRRSLRSWQDRVRDPSLTALLVLEICLVFLAAPLAAQGLSIARPVVETLVLAVLIIVVMLSHRRGAIVAILLGLAADLASLSFGAEWPPIVASVLRRGGNALTFAALTWVVAHAVYAPGRITFHRLQAPPSSI